MRTVFHYRAPSNRALAAVLGILFAVAALVSPPAHFVHDEDPATLAWAPVDGHYSGEERSLPGSAPDDAHGDCLTCKVLSLPYTKADPGAVPLAPHAPHLQKPGEDPLRPASPAFLHHSRAPPHA